MKRRPTAADRCEDCALNRSKARRCNTAEQGEFLDFDLCLQTETPFWCHGSNARQVCRGWLAIMERRWTREGWDSENPRDPSPLRSGNSFKKEIGRGNRQRTEGA